MAVVSQCLCRLGCFVVSPLCRGKGVKPRCVSILECETSYLHQSPVSWYCKGHGAVLLSYIERVATLLGVCDSKETQQHRVAKRVLWFGTLAEEAAISPDHTDDASSTQMKTTFSCTTSESGMKDDFSCLDPRQWFVERGFQNASLDDLPPSPLV